MAIMKIEFEWTRAFAKAAGAHSYEYANGKIRQIGRGKQRYLPLASQSLYLDFARLNASPSACVAFAEKWGLLVTPASSTEPPAEDLSFWRAEIKKMQSLIGMLPTVVGAKLSRHLRASRLA